MIDQEEIHNQCFGKDPEESIKALEQLKSNFSSLPDKEKAGNDLHRLTNNEDSNVRWKVAGTIRSAFSNMPDKQKAWNDLIKLTNDEDWWVRAKAASALGSAFSDVPDKQKAWNDLIKLINGEDSDVRYRAASALGSAFSDMPDKQKAWNDLHKLTNDEDKWVRYEATSALSFAFSQIPDKQQAWEDLHRLTNDESSDVKATVASVLDSVFFDLPDKQQAWNDLIKLTNDKDSYVRSKAASLPGSVFFDVPDKQKAWNDLINNLVKLTNDKDSYVRFKAASALGSVFFDVPDKQQAWNDLIKLTTADDWTVRHKAASLLGSAFSGVPDKQQTWNDLIKLTTADDWTVRSKAASLLGSAFSDVLDKQKAWNDLHKLTAYINSAVRCKAASVIGSVFSEVSDKQQVWNDLIKLTNDEDHEVRAYANHSLGKISIFKASQSEKEEEYTRELETAIAFFEKATKESWWNNPSRFCLPFYRSFHTIIFKKQDAKEEVDKYLAEAKDAVGSSKSKELLLEAVNNLSNALKEVQNLGNLDLETKKGELNFYKTYCDRAAELMIDTEKTAPFATIAMRKGLPILDRNLKKLLAEIQKKAKIACKEAKGTATEEITCTVYSEIQTWEIGSQEEMAFNVENLIFTLESNVPRIQENQYIFNRIQQIREQKDVSKQYGIVSTIIPLIPKLYMEQTVGKLENEVKEIKEKVDCIIITLKPGIKEEIEISVGTKILGIGMAHKVTVSLQEISYPELKEDLEKITGMKIDKLSKLPKRLAKKVKGYLLLHDKDDILEKLT